MRGGYQALHRRFGEVCCSPVYESAPVGFVGPAFYNLVMSFETGDTIAELRAALRGIEREHGRADGGRAGTRGRRWRC